MKSLVIVLLFLSATSGAQQASKKSFSIWWSNQVSVSTKKVLQAVSAPDANKGAVYASPSRAMPDYYRHWIRDAALVMREVEELASRSHGAVKDRYDQELYEYAVFSKENQNCENKSGSCTPGSGPVGQTFLTNDIGLGEPLFRMSGDAFNEGWGRPQSDGPALRAITLIQTANRWLQEGDEKRVRFVKEVLYDGRWSSDAFPQSPSVIKRDLQYVANNWRLPSFDLWEEKAGDHFYTRLVQYRALVVGAQFARLMGDEGGAGYYESTAGAIRKSLASFWNEEKGYVVSTQNQWWSEGRDSYLDISVILGVLHAGEVDGEFSVFDERIVATAKALTTRFLNLYPINKVAYSEKNGPLAPAIGRYPEDHYDGVFDDNIPKPAGPWILATLALAEFHLKRGDVATALPFLHRVKEHTNLSLSEQLDPATGELQGAADLTWSYAAVLSCERAFVAARR
jgi:glucoamylase